MNYNNVNEKIIKLTDLCKSFFNLLKVLKDLWLFLFPILAVLIGLLNVKKIQNFLISNNIMSQEMIDFFAKNSNGFLLMFLIILIIILVVMIRKTGKKRIQINNTSYNTLSELHEELAHKLRDGICDLYLKNERLIELKSFDNEEAINEVKGRAFDNLVYNMQNFVDLIADHLSEYNNDTISVCIKIINPGQESIDNSEKKAKTLVRSKNTVKSRKRENEIITLGKNTDFKHLCDGTNIWYNGVNLEAKHSQGEYENEVPIKDWKEKYNSTIVVPIRYRNTDIKVPINDILGFICIDSKKIVDSWNKIEPYEFHYLAMFSDLIYTYIKLFRRLFEER